MKSRLFFFSPHRGKYGKLQAAVACGGVRHCEVDVAGEFLSGDFRRHARNRGGERGGKEEQGILGGSYRCQFSGRESFPETRGMKACVDSSRKGSMFNR